MLYLIYKKNMTKLPHMRNQMSGRENIQVKVIRSSFKQNSNIGTIILKMKNLEEK